MISHNFFSAFILLIIYHLMTPFTLSSQLSIDTHQGQNAEGTSAGLLDFIKTEFEKQNHRIKHLELKNINQDEDIDLPKRDNSKIHDRIDLIIEEYEQLNEVTSTIYGDKLSYSNDYAVNVPTAKKQYGQKRPARLLPLSLLYHEKQVIPTVPFNCSDLSKMGHTMNGIYLVKRGNTNRNSRINVVLCDFQPPVLSKKSSSLYVVEERLGFLDLKPSTNSADPSTGICFYAQRGAGQTSKDGVVRFHKEHLNIGNGMNITTGIFTAPKAGIYHFSLAIEKEARSLAALHIFLRVKKVKIALAVVSPSPFSSPAVIQSTLKLKKGDRVDVWKPNTGTIGECTVLGGDAAEPHCHHFTSWLLEEDLN